MGIDCPCPEPLWSLQAVCSPCLMMWRHCYLWPREDVGCWTSALAWGELWWCWQSSLCSGRWLHPFGWTPLESFSRSFQVLGTAASTSLSQLGWASFLSHHYYFVDVASLPHWLSLFHYLDLMNHPLHPVVSCRSESSYLLGRLISENWGSNLMKQWMKITKM